MKTIIIWKIAAVMQSAAPDIRNLRSKSKVEDVFKENIASEKKNDNNRSISYQPYQRLGRSQKGLASACEPLLYDMRFDNNKILMGLGNMH